MAETQMRAVVEMTYPEACSITVLSRDVKRLPLSDIPETLRDEAVYTLRDRPGSRWWTVGVFRYGRDFEMGVARRVDGCIQYGFERG